MGSDSEDPGRPSSPDAPGISRRTLMRGASALGIAATAFRALPASAASGSRNFLGSNLNIFETIRSGETISGVAYPGVPGLRGIRMYGEHPTKNSDGSWTNHVRSTWPQPIPPGSTTPIANPGPVVYSIYPVIPDVMDGTLDRVLESLIGSAPPDSYLNCWHEALSLDYSQYPFVTSNAMYQLHARMNAKVRGSNVTYGSIFGGWDGDLPTLFRSAPPNLGFYGQDMYAFGGSGCSSGITAGMQHLDDFITRAKAKDTITPGYPKLLIPECNYAPDCSLTDHPALRGQWLEAVATRMHHYGSNSIGVLTFWRPGGGLSGAWDPSRPWGKSTINAMKTITTTIF
jgi:hypothetical protein